ncbi:TPA: 50S ribosomal protein L27 [Patescibacteria group bacterium]|uniref:Large ribosomal subunit protein bL27 n=2 Tax=Bacteria division Kazan-3B-28 TaxID=1798534 RepID=A0A0G1KTM2_UNCK3|nr:MAG: 50S ribosomal protein L27 [candidate division Kazan bacterium GW2011_GWA1_44_22]KKT86986.1 MAG: 50S ribosomal protein L27 [candidate division Kazan bacterium GW2011_GWB1_45_10]HAR54978.1 50S ribosomal protein L27 [Patescibacteria group bacterium]HCR42208.1 50S ribosomal protein L27 [Patescibacteria group bacterium]
MAHVKAGGTAKNLRDSKPKMLGVKIYGGQKIKTGQIILRQRGQKYRAGQNVGMGTDHTLFAKRDGKVKFAQKQVRSSGINLKKATFVNVV